MSASGRTPHLHLSQYDDTDHPSYVGDYTEDMGRIDTGFNLAQTNALNALNRVAALERGIGRAGAVGQTVMLPVKGADTGMADNGVFTLGFELPVFTFTRNAEPAAVPWTWVRSNDHTVGGAAGLAVAGRGVYRVTVEADATYRSSPDISFADIRLTAGLGGHCVPLVHNGDRTFGRAYGAACSFVVPCSGGGEDWGIELETSFAGDATPSGAQIQCDLTVDVELLSTEYSEEASPGQPE